MTTETPKKRPATYYIYKSDGSASGLDAGPLAGFTYVSTVEGSKADAEAAASEAAGGEPCTIKVLQDRGTATVEMKPTISW